MIPWPSDMGFARSVAVTWALVLLSFLDFVICEAGIGSKALTAKNGRFGLDRDLQGFRSGSDLSSEC